jgi:hypothetical protein
MPATMLPSPLVRPTGAQVDVETPRSQRTGQSSAATAVAWATTPYARCGRTGVERRPEERCSTSVLREGARAPVAHGADVERSGLARSHAFRR